MHCSAGVGRTGTIIAVDRVRQMLQAKNFPKSFTIMQMVKELREQRMKMVQVKPFVIFKTYCVVERLLEF